MGAPGRLQLVTKGIRLPLEIFKTPGGTKGWGVRCSELIPSGSFICEYAGLLLSEEEAVRPASADYVTC
eukprot:scaffold650405_cov51-Prasinocladus_malaysianus.AAC.1